MACRALRLILAVEENNTGIETKISTKIFKISTFLTLECIGAPSNPGVRASPRRLGNRPQSPEPTPAAGLSDGHASIARLAVQKHQQNKGDSQKRQSYHGVPAEDVSQSLPPPQQQVKKHDAGLHEKARNRTGMLKAMAASQGEAAQKNEKQAGCDHTIANAGHGLSTLMMRTTGWQHHFKFCEGTLFIFTMVK